MFTLRSPAREVITEGRKAVIANGDGVENQPCYWADRGLEECGRRNLKAFCDLGAEVRDVNMTAMYMVCLPYLQPLFDREAQLYIAKSCSRHPRAAAWLRWFFGDSLPEDIRAGVERVRPIRRGEYRGKVREDIRRDFG